MKPILSMGIVVFSLFLTAFMTVAGSAAFANSEFDQAFTRHRDQGSLFGHAASEGFRQCGWGARYVDAVAAMGAFRWRVYPWRLR